MTAARTDDVRRHDYAIHLEDPADVAPARAGVMQTR